MLSSSVGNRQQTFWSGGSGSGTAGGPRMRRSAEAAVGEEIALRLSGQRARANDDVTVFENNLFVIYRSEPRLTTTLSLSRPVSRGEPVTTFSHNSDFIFSGLLGSRSLCGKNPPTVVSSCRRRLSCMCSLA